MAATNITLKRITNADGTATVLHPTTNITQIFTDENETTSLTSYLSTTYIPATQKAAANGVATLDANGFIPADQLGKYIQGGLRLRGTLNNTTQNTMYAILYGFTQDATYNQAAGASSAEYEEFVGNMYVATENMTLIAGNSVSGFAYTIQAPGDEGDYTLPIDLEQGDMLVVVGYSYPSSVHTFNFAIINNTHGAASTASSGIVTLSSSTSTATTGNNVITDGILNGLIGTTATTIAAGNHTHDDRYFTETEINNFFSGTTAKSGYNKSNWDTAYGWGNHATAGYLTSQTSHADVVVDGDFTSQGIMLRGATAGSYSILTDNSANWNTAYGWGDHGLEGYWVDGSSSLNLGAKVLANDTGILEWDSYRVWNSNDGSLVQYGSSIPGSGNIVGTIFIDED